MLAGGVDELASADVELVAAFKSNERMCAVYRYIIGEGLTFDIFFLANTEESGVLSRSFDNVIFAGSELAASAAAFVVARAVPAGGAAVIGLFGRV